MKVCEDYSPFQRGDVRVRCYFSESINYGIFHSQCNLVSNISIFSGIFAYAISKAFTGDQQFLPITPNGKFSHQVSQRRRNHDVPRILVVAAWLSKRVG